MYVDKTILKIPAISNAEENKIITGVRFVKKKGVIHLEVEQAKATEEGHNFARC